jgi:hypothetical protein
MVLFKGLKGFPGDFDGRFDLNFGLKRSYLLKGGFELFPAGGRHDLVHADHPVHRNIDRKVRNRYRVPMSAKTANIWRKCEVSEVTPDRRP